MRSRRRATFLCRDKALQLGAGDACTSLFRRKGGGASLRPTPRHQRRPMGSVGSAHPDGARPIGGAMAAPVRDREALQRLNFLFQGPLCEAPHVPPLLLPVVARGWGLPAAERGGAAPDRAAVPELRPSPALPVSAGAPPPGPSPAHWPHPGHQPSINPTRRQSSDATSNWSLQKPPLANQKTAAAEINLPLFYIWY
ncbi:ribonuclease P protein subunit p21 isoform X2 [Strix uralensis]|uniref:ribonuclease P protein subunit p21 isoform X2 n=1 Tax=Strix uralensis TaxID=36305 RepID=UPI003DA7033E